MADRWQKRNGGALSSRAKWSEAEWSRGISQAADGVVLSWVACEIPRLRCAPLGMTRLRGRTPRSAGFGEDGMVRNERRVVDQAKTRITLASCVGVAIQRLTDHDADAFGARAGIPLVNRRTRISLVSEYL